MAGSDGNESMKIAEPEELVTEAEIYGAGKLGTKV